MPTSVVKAHHQNKCQQVAAQNTGENNKLKIKGGSLEARSITFTGNGEFLMELFHQRRNKTRKRGAGLPERLDRQHLKIKKNFDWLKV